MSTGISPLSAVRGVRPHLDVAEIAAVRERGVQRVEVAAVVRIAAANLHVRVDQLVAQHVLLERDLAETVALAGVEAQHDVGDALLRVHVDAIRGELRLRVAALGREIEPAALQRLVVAVVQNRAYLDRRLFARAHERRVLHRFADELHVEIAHERRRADADRELRVPALRRAVE